MKVRPVEIGRSSDLPPLVRVALIHAQFETIHPFLDGNGRIGRLLIAALLEHWKLLKEPLMYLSGFLKRHQAEYYRRLSAVRSEGDWEGWVSFFLEGVAAGADDAERGIIGVASLITADRKRLLESPKAGPISYRLFELLPMMPRFNIEHVRLRLETTFPTASAAVRPAASRRKPARRSRAEPPKVTVSAIRIPDCLSTDCSCAFQIPPHLA